MVTRALFLDLCILFAHFGKFATVIVTPSSRHLRILCQPVEYLQRCHRRKIGALIGSGRMILCRFCERATQSLGLGYPPALGESLQPCGSGGIIGFSELGIGDAVETGFYGNQYCSRAGRVICMAVADSAYCPGISHVSHGFDRRQHSITPTLKR